MNGKMEKNLTQLAVTIFGHYHLRLRLNIYDKIKEKKYIIKENDFLIKFLTQIYNFEVNKEI